MFYIKLGYDMQLSITIREPIYRGDNLNQKLVYLLPTSIGEIDMLTAIPYLNYIRADGVADVVRLDRSDEKYNESYYQYEVPVSCRLSKYPGEVCSWLQIYSGTPSNPTIAKSSECVLHIQDSKNMDDYICDHQLTAIYQMQKKIDGGSSGGDSDSGDTPDWEDMGDTETTDDPTPDWETMDVSDTSDDTEAGDATWDEM